MKEKKFKKGAIILGIIIIIAFITSITLWEVTSQAKHRSAANIQSGFTVTLGNYMYFSNPTDKDKLYKIKKDGTGLAKLSDDCADELVLADNQIFYANNSDGGKLYKINVDGTGRIAITQSAVNYINGSFDGIYYSNIKDGCKLYFIGFNGKGNIRLSDESASFINIVGSSIYYRNGQQKIIKINSDGKGRTVLEDQKVSFLKADNDGKIYFGLQSDNCSIYSINSKGGKSNKVLKTNTLFADTYDQWIYFINTDDDNPEVYSSYLYRVKKDGTGMQRLSVESIAEFSFLSNRIIYKSLEGGSKVYTMNLDGTDRKALDGKTSACSVDEICRALKDKVDFDISDKKLSQAYNKAKEILSVIIKPNMSELEKEISIHDYLVKNVKYDSEVTDALNNNLVVNLDSHDPYNLLINGKGVCDGFAWTTKLMLGICGIDSDVVTGNTETNKDGNKSYHAWNIVKIDGKYYDLDVTWDENIYEQLGMLCYKYFNVSDSIMAEDHDWDGSYYAKCTSTKYNYFNKLGLVARDNSALYYSNESDNYKMYRIDIDGSENKEINVHQSFYMAISGGWIYYSDYEDGGALYKMSTDGKNNTKLCSGWCINIEVKDGYIEYVDHDTKQKHKIKV